MLYLIRIYFLQLLGGLYLVYLATTHFLPKKEQGPKAQPSFWRACFMIELTDLLFALDSILAAVALVKTYEGNPESKLWLIYLAAFSGMILLRYAAFYVQKALDKFPNLELCTHLIIGVIGLKLILEPLLYFPIGWIFWVFVLSLLVFGFFKRPVRLK